jgi:hypothetical protein
VTLLLLACACALLALTVRNARRAAEMGAA